MIQRSPYNIDCRFTMNIYIFVSGVKQESHTHRERHNSNRHNSTSEDSGTPRTYVPTQFENSLGKLQVCNVLTIILFVVDESFWGGLFRWLIETEKWY